MSVLREGEWLDRYRIDAVLLEREGAVVYAATEDATLRAVAITVLEEPSPDEGVLRARAERAEQAAGLARMRSVEPIAIGRLADGSAFVVNERIASLPIIARSPAPIGAVFGSIQVGAGPMDPGRAMLALSSQRARRRAGGRLVRIGVRTLLVAALAVGVAWLALGR